MIISIISTFYNEEENINLFYSEIKNILVKKKIEYEFIFVNDCSTDKSEEIVKKICEKDLNVKLINTSRKFGSSRVFLCRPKIHERGCCYFYRYRSARPSRIN